MEIELFQLENLILTRTRFAFLDLRKVQTENIPTELQTILKQADFVATESVKEHLRGRQVDIAAPVVLLCENGKTSALVARDLEAAGYQNIYIVARGEAGLLLEF